MAQGQLLPPQGLLVPDISSSNTYHPHLLAVCPLFHLSALGTLTAAWAPGKGVCVGVFDALAIFGCEVVILQTLNPSSWAPGKGVCVGVFGALAIFGCEVVILQTLNPSSCLYRQISKAQQSGQSRVVGAWVELLPVRILVEILECLDNCRQFSASRTVVSLGFGQSFAEVGHNPFAAILYLGQNFTNPTLLALVSTMNLSPGSG